MAAYYRARETEGQDAGQKRCQFESWFILGKLWNLTTKSQRDLWSCDQRFVLGCGKRKPIQDYHSTSKTFSYTPLQSFLQLILIDCKLCSTGSLILFFLSKIFLFFSPFFSPPRDCSLNWKSEMDWADKDSCITFPKKLTFINHHNRAENSL